MRATACYTLRKSDTSPRSDFQAEPSKFYHLLPIRSQARSLTNVYDPWEQRNVRILRRVISSRARQLYGEKGWSRSLRYVWAVYLLPSLHSVSNLRTNISGISLACVNDTFNTHMCISRGKCGPTGPSSATRISLIGNSRAPIQSRRWTIIDDNYHETKYKCCNNDNCYDFYLL